MEKENKAPEQTNFDRACDVFFASLEDYSVDYEDEDSESIIIALKSFRDELREQMGNDTFVAEYKNRSAE